MPKVLIVEAPYYQDIVEELAQGAVEALEEEGYEYEIIKVTGALEIPPAIKMAAETKKFDGFVALGCVMRGETVHFDIVALESSRGIMNLGVDLGLAIGNGILTVENHDQAIERADRRKQNRGAEAARACLCLMNLKKVFKKL